MCGFMLSAQGVVLAQTVKRTRQPMSFSERPIFGNKLSNFCRRGLQRLLACLMSKLAP